MDLDACLRLSAVIASGHRAELVLPKSDEDVMTTGDKN